MLAPVPGVQLSIRQFAGQRSRRVHVHPVAPGEHAVFDGCAKHEPCSPPQSASVWQLVPGRGTVVMSTVLPSSHVSVGDSTIPFPHTGAPIVVVLVVDVVAVLVVLVEVTVLAVDVVTLVDELLLDDVVLTVVHEVLVEEVVVTVVLLVLDELVVVTDVLLVLVTLVDVVVLGHGNTTGSAAFSCATITLRSVLWPAASRQAGQRLAAISFAPRASNLAVATASQTSTTNGFVLKSASAFFRWQERTSFVSLAAFLATPSAHLATGLLVGLKPASSSMGSRSTPDAVSQ